MKKISLFCGRLKSMSIKKMLLMIKQASREHKKSPIMILLDMLLCAVKLNIGYQDYRVLGFAGLSKAERKTFLTMNKNIQLVKKMNNESGRKVFSDKRLFFKKYEKYIKRAWIDISDKSPEEFEVFCKDKKSIFAKAPCSFGGQGICEIRTEKGTNLKLLYKELIKNKQFLVEEKIAQHEKMSALHSSSLNTLRIATLKKDDKIHIICRILRIGQQGSVIDNITSGGIYVPIDENGIISGPAFCDKTGVAFSVHPSSKVFLPGYEIPFFKEAVKLVSEIAEEENDVCYVGWDVAITPNGPLIVEGNEIPSYEIMQNYLHLNGKNGLLPVIEKILGEKI